MQERYRPSSRSEEFKKSGFGPLQGYTGNIRKQITKEEGPTKLFKIPGYCGHIEGSKSVYGKPVIPNEFEQSARMEEKISLQGMRQSKQMMSSFSKRNLTTQQESVPEESLPDIDLQERYLHAMEQLFHRGQTPQMLLRTLQGKISERVTDYSMELRKVKRLFEAHDKSGKGLNFNSFQKCIEQIGCHFDDVQSLALFSFFDDNNNGLVDWNELSDNVIMFNPGGGKIVPKQITATMFTEDWASIDSRKKDIFH